jgi:hypothetical protein
MKDELGWPAHVYLSISLNRVELEKFALLFQNFTSLWQIMATCMMVTRSNCEKSAQWRSWYDRHVEQDMEIIEMAMTSCDSVVMCAGKLKSKATSVSICARPMLSLLSDSEAAPII